MGQYQRRILVLEDDLALQPVLEEVIRAVVHDTEVQWVTTAEEALYHLKAQIAGKEIFCDLIIADIFLEGNITGMDLCNTCQVIAPQIPILIMSAMPLDMFFKCVGPRAIAPPFLSKPFQLGECHQVLSGLLSQASSDGYRAA